jgi:CheY-like chemotaxis protein
MAVISDVLDIAKIESGKTVLSAASFALESLIRDVLAVVGQAATSKGLTLEVDTNGVPSSLVGDETRLVQILVNFIGNAVKATSSGGIKLLGRVMKDDPSNCLVRFEVHDTGIGIPFDQQERLFVSFEQIAGAGRPNGAGLGLAISRHLAAMMGGEVGMKSVPGEDSMFWFTARLGRGASLTPEPELHESTAEVMLLTLHAGKRVMVAEDNSINRELACFLLESVGLQPVEAVDGAEAARLAEAEGFAMILMDMRMPKMNGLEATRAIRKLPQHARTPIVAMTANAFGDDRAACLEAGMNGFITKPTRPDALFAKRLKWMGPVSG